MLFLHIQENTGMFQWFVKQISGEVINSSNISLFFTFYLPLLFCKEVLAINGNLICLFFFESKMLRQTKRWQ